jgi:leader peptidase (prepilin peptidase) / N-methyltransferase
MIFAVGAALFGWLAGGLANWAADTLPGLSDPVPGWEAPAGAMEPGPAAIWVRRGLAPFHYLTLPWYPFLRGVCPHCGVHRAWRAPALEAASILLFIAAWLRVGGRPLNLAITWLYIAFLLAVLVIDFEHRRVLNVMLLPAAGAALAFSFLPGQPGLISALLGAAAGLGLFLIFALISRGHLGAGDVKLAAVLGLMLGFPAVFYALFAGVILGGVAALALLVTRRAGRKSYMAYAPYLSVGALGVLLQLLGH